MYPYNLAQWFLFFYIYCFLGWVWETCYVSLKQKRWVNRGFMHGPFLPIYGCGAIIVLLSTIPVKDYFGLVFICGMTGATLLEYFTGETMERIFHVRYWDYSTKRFNLNGHICLLSSLAWGLFSMLMIYVLHQPIEQMIFVLDQSMTELITFGLTIGVAVDLTESFNEAMDLKEMLMNLSESNAEVQLIRKRLDVVIAIVDTDANKIKEKLLISKQRLEEILLEEKNHYREKIKNEINDKTISGRKVLESKIEMIKQGKNQVLASLAEGANAYIEQIDEYISEKGIQPAKEITKLRGELVEVIERLTRQKEKVFELKTKTYRHCMSLLKRNPEAVSKKYEGALNEIKEIGNIEKESQ